MEMQENLGKEPTYYMSFKLWLEGQEIPQNIGVGLLPIAKDTGRILLGFRSAYVAHPNCWSTWGGKVESMNFPKEVKREFKEETEFNGTMNLTPAFVFQNEHYSYHNFIATLKKEFVPILNWETADARWFTLPQLLKLSNKHFGLTLLLQNSMGIINNIIHETKPKNF